MAKPIVDGIESELEGEAKVIRLSLLSRLGRSVAQRYGVRAVPTIIIFDGNGDVVEHRAGIPNQQQVVQQVHYLLP
jgi:thioredoxin-related protein